MFRRLTKLVVIALVLCVVTALVPNGVNTDVAQQYTAGSTCDTSQAANIQSRPGRGLIFPTVKYVDTCSQQNYETHVAWVNIGLNFLIYLGILLLVTIGIPHHAKNIKKAVRAK